jgi:hypothetical protein
MNLPIAKLLPILLLVCSCSFQLGGRATSDGDADATSVTAQRQPADQATECSRLRADIASAQHNQRNAPPTSNSPIIAAASAGKADLRVEELQQRFDRLGCVKNPSATDAADADSAAPGPQQ